MTTTSCRDQYHHAVDNSHRTGALGAQDIDSMIHEIDSLRRWKAEAECVIEEWDQLWEEAGCPGQLGQTHAAGLLAALKSDGII